MTAQEKAEVERSPLDQIRQVESEVARSIADARNRANDTAKEMSAQADDIKHKARSEGRREGEQHYQEIITEANMAAERLLEQAHTQAEELRQTGKSQINAAARFAVDTVIGSHQETAEA